MLGKHDATDNKPNIIMHIAHGAAMIGAFCLMMPLAGLIARHRWVFAPANEVRVVEQEEESRVLCVCVCDAV